METAAWASAQTLLCVRLDTLGDVLMTTPALRALRAGNPERRITLLTSAPGARVARLVPEIDEVLVYEAPWMKASPQRSTAGYDRAFATALRGRRFDAAVIFTVFSQNPLPAAMLCYLADIPLRLAHCRENPYHLLTNWVPEPEPQTTIRHEVQRQLDLVANVGFQTCNQQLSLRVPPEAMAAIETRLANAGVQRHGNWLVVHPGATAASRRYPPEHFVAVLRGLVLRHGFQVVLTGDQGEQPLVEEIRQVAAVPTVSFAGQLELSQMAGLLAVAPLLLSNNTGPVHMAAALGTPVVDLYALTNPQHTPWQVPHRTLSHDVPCKNCFKSICPEGHHRCLRGIRPKQVVEAVLELFQEVHSEGKATFHVHAGN